jgi:hypothetical protein
MLASLPMYDWPEIRSATDAWWAGIARHAGLGFPLTRVPDYAELWRRDDLVFSQTCGYPFTHGLAATSISLRRRIMTRKVVLVPTT